MKNQNGITLIALVITIIVLIILAGVAIAMLSGDNGILNKASESAATNALGAAKDQSALLATEELSNYYDTVYASSNGGQFDSEALDSQIKTKITTDSIDVQGITAAWGTDTEAKKLTLTYTDGSSVSGTLASGKIEWGEMDIK